MEAAPQKKNVLVYLSKLSSSESGNRMARTWFNKEGAPMLFLAAFFKIPLFKLSKIKGIPTILKTSIISNKETRAL